MALEKNSVGIIVLIAFIGALIGTVVSKMIVVLIPATGGFLKATSVDLFLNLEIIRLGIKFNFISVIGVIGALLIFRKI